MAKKVVGNVPNDFGSITEFQVLQKWGGVAKEEGDGVGIMRKRGLDG